MLTFFSQPARNCQHLFSYADPFYSFLILLPIILFLLFLPIVFRLHVPLVLLVFLIFFVHLVFLILLHHLVFLLIFSPFFFLIYNFLPLQFSLFFAFPWLSFNFCLLLYLFLFIRFPYSFSDPFFFSFSLFNLLLPTHPKLQMSGKSFVVTLLSLLFPVSTLIFLIFPLF